MTAMIATGIHSAEAHLGAQRRRRAVRHGLASQRRSRLMVGADIDAATQHRLRDRGRLADLAWKAHHRASLPACPAALRCIRLALVPVRPIPHNGTPMWLRVCRTPIVYADASD